MKKLLLLFFLIFQIQSVADTVTHTKQLHAGSRTIFYPKKGETFSVTKDFRHLVPDANYDVKMQNRRGDIYFDNRHQDEDMYIIFNETVSPGDKLILKVNRGYFNIKTETLQTLPKTVKKILAASAKRRSHAKKRIERKMHTQITTEEYCFDEQGEIIECSSPKALINHRVDREFLPQPETKTASKNRATETVTDKKEKQKRDIKERKHENIFSSFADKLKAALAKIKKTLAQEQSEKQPPQKKKETNASGKENSSKPKLHPKSLHSAQSQIKNIPVKESKKPLSKRHAERQKSTPLPRKGIVKPSPAEIDRYAGAAEGESEFARRVKLPTFHAIPLNVQKPLFEAYAIDTDHFIQKPDLKKSIQPVTSDATAPAPMLRRPLLSGKPQNLSQQASLPENLDRGHQKLQMLQNQPAFRQKEQGIVAKPVSGPQKIATPTMTSTPPLKRRGIPKVAQRKEEAPKQSIGEKNRPPVIAAAQTPVAAVQEKPATVAQTQQLQTPPAVSDVSPQPSAVEKPPVIVENEVNEPTAEQEPKDKIVITKILKKEQNATVAPMIRMQDRVLGGGYSARQNSGKLSVRAYANRKPVSAWVEVFKGKRRVKTFYSGVKREVSLPEGTYILKATYRAGSSKQRKNLGRVKLKNGESIHKKVYFAIGTLNVIAKRKGKPLYVKVEIFKKGSSRRYAYTFSSRDTGIAHLQLGQGHYRIVVRAYGKTKRFDDVYVKGERTKTLLAEF